MRKKSFNKRHGLFSILIATAFIAASIFSITACKKETSTPPGQTAINSENDQKVTDHIRAFKEKMEYYRDNPQLKGGGETYSAEEASIELESLLNYDFCYTNVECNVKTYSVSQIIMPLDDLKRINDPALMQVYYDRVIDTIQAQMLRVNYTNMKLLLVDLELDGYDSNGDATVNIGSLVGNQYPQVLHNDNWWYGENLGMCGNYNNAPEDAASQLQKRVIDQLLPDPTQGCRWYFPVVVSTSIDPLQHSLIELPNNPEDNYLDYKVFYATEAVSNLDYDVKCLSMYEMSFYEDHYIDFAEDFISSVGMPFADCSIEGKPGTFLGQDFIQHYYHIFAGDRILECSTSVDDILSIN